MTDPTTEWADTDELVLGGLAAGLTHAEAGELASVGAKTVQRRLRDAVFAAEVGRRSTEARYGRTRTLNATVPATVRRASRSLTATVPLPSPRGALAPGPIVTVLTEFCERQRRSGERQHHGAKRVGVSISSAECAGHGTEEVV